MAEKPTYEELERRVQELEKIECEYKASRKALQETEGLFKMLYEKAPLGYQSLDENGHFQQTHCIFHDITDRKQAEEALRESEEKYRILFEHTGEGLFVAQDGKIVLHNPRNAELTGYSTEELKSKPFIKFIHKDDREMVMSRHLQRLRGENPPERYAFRFIHSSGNIRWVALNAVMIQWNAKPATLCFITDITEQKQAQKAVTESEALFRGMFNDHSAVMLLIDPATGQIIKANQSAVQYYGYPLEKMLQMKIQQLNISSPEQIDKQMQYALNKQLNSFEFQHLMEDGQIRDVEVHSAPIIIQHRKLLFSIIHDITERKKAEETLNKSHEMLKFTETMANIGSWEWDVQHDRTYWSEELFRIFGRDPSEGAPPFAEQSELYADGDMQRLRDVVESCIRRGTRYEIELRAIRTDGEIRHCVSRGKAQYDENGKVFRLIGSFQDITKRKLSEDALRESENQINSIFRSAPVGIGSVVNRVLSKVNKRLCEITGYDGRELIGQCSRMLYPSDEDFEYVGREKYAQIADHGTGTVETRWQKKDGTIIDVLLSSTPVDLQDQSKGVTFTALNITERKQAEMALKESEERFRTLMENIDAVAVQGYGHDGTTQYWNKASERLYGYSRQEAIGRNLFDLIIPSEMKGAVVEEMQEMAESGQPIPSGELLLMHKNGSRVPVISHHAIVRVPGREQELFCLDVDITERKKAEEERENLRKQLNQAQKMESVGRLAGGVAHDYNNMLGVILGHTELALLQADESHDLYSDLKEIQTAATRSADITKQLLAFARKQTISPRQLDLNNTVESMLNLLRRLIGESIDLVWQPSAHLWSVKMDPSQIDQILANLCVNARDAIDGVGKLTIETERKSFDEEYCKEHPGFIPGDFVLLTVSDNGCGMGKHTLDNLFEPFFTTKEVGKGTGLGLATVYGIVKQNNGFINVYSEPGRGSTFKIYLPRLVADEDTDKTVPEKKAAAGGTETILLVEDEPAILRMTCMMLERKGYTVLSAATPTEAMEKAKEHSGSIDMLMSDVVMPEMNGRDLAEKIIALHPDIKLLFMSGYTEDIIAHQGILDDGVKFIQKPFSIADLAETLRGILDKVAD